MTEIITYQDFIKSYESSYISSSTIRFILHDLYGSSEYKTRLVYKAMNKKFQKSLKEKDLVNPGINGIPRRIVKDYFDLLDIDEASIQSKAKAHFNED